MDFLYNCAIRTELVSKRDICFVNARDGDKGKKAFESHFCDQNLDGWRLINELLQLHLLGCSRFVSMFEELSSRYVWLLSFWLCSFCTSFLLN